MQAVVPMHTFWLIQTIPSARFSIAPVGHAVRQGASSQWLHRTGAKVRLAEEYSCSSSFSITFIQWMFRGVPFSTLQAITQAWQPTHRSRSTVYPHRAIANPFLDESRPCSLARHHRAGSKLYAGVRSLGIRRPDSIHLSRSCLLGRLPRPVYLSSLPAL